MKFDEGWVNFFSQELPKGYFKSVAETVQNQRTEGRKVYPTPGHIFEAFVQSPFADLKAVIVGGDPYSAEGHATGLAYSQPAGVPPSTEIRNIYKELNNSISTNVPVNPDLTSWSKSGILLLNNVLTVETGKPKSHRDLGWEQFTQNCLKFISDNKQDRVIFALWGTGAHKHAPFIDRKKHTVLKASDPAAGANGFYGCGHFIHINQVTRLWE